MKGRETLGKAIEGTAILNHDVERSFSGIRITSIYRKF